MKRGPQSPPKRSKNDFNGIFGYRGPIWGPKKIFVDFRDGVSESVYRLTERRHVYVLIYLQIDSGAEAEATKGRVKKVIFITLGPDLPSH